MAGTNFRVGIMGLGAAARMMLPALAEHPGIQIAGVVDPDEEVRLAVAREWRVRHAATLDALVQGGALDAVYIATPTGLHAQHTKLAAEAGLHVLCEKPMAVNLEEGTEMVETMRRAGRVLMIGHSRSFDAPIDKMREIIESGSMGEVRMITQISYTDWMYRPRRPDELDPRQGGGVTYRQGAHQFDIVRLLAGGIATEVTAAAFNLDPRRSGTGAHTALIRFANGAVANVIYNGYGGFSTAEWCDGIGESGFPVDQALVGSLRRTHMNGSADEFTAKRARAAVINRGEPPCHPALGITLVSCEGGDLRQSPSGLVVYSAEGREEVTVPLRPGPQSRVVDEFYDAMAARAPIHDGAWGLANLELCVAATESAESQRPVALSRQVPLRGAR